MDTVQPFLPLLGLALDLLIAYQFLQDLYRPERRVLGGDKTLWAAVIVFGSVVGWAAYLFYGRQA